MTQEICLEECNNMACDPLRTAVVTKTKEIIRVLAEETDKLCRVSLDLARKLWRPTRMESFRRLWLTLLARSLTRIALVRVCNITTTGQPCSRVPMTMQHCRWWKIFTANNRTWLAILSMLAMINAKKAIFSKTWMQEKCTNIRPREESLMATTTLRAQAVETWTKEAITDHVKSNESFGTAQVLANSNRRIQINSCYIRVIASQSLVLTLARPTLI